MIWLAGLVLMAASCGSGSSDSTDATSTGAESVSDSAEVEGDEADASSEGSVADEGSDEVAEEAESGWVVAVDLAAEPGARPTFEWDEVDGATAYELYVVTSDGEAYWAWLGEDTSTALGGLPLLEPGASGPRLSVGMTWELDALDADGELITSAGGGFPDG